MRIVYTPTQQPMNTNWSSPKTNFFAGIMNLRSALNSGYKAKLIREYNEKCSHPIREKVEDKDFRAYKHFIGYQSTKNAILNANNYTEFEKYLALNYKGCFGTKEAAEQYYKHGVLSADNFKGMGFSHLVKVSDMVDFMKANNYDVKRIKMFDDQYINGSEANTRHFYDFFTPIAGNEHKIKKFNKKLWVVVLLDDKAEVKIPVLIKTLNWILFPLKYIPKKSVLRLPEYTLYKFSIGAITSGYHVEFHIPKKFRFKDK